ncbi:DUF2950 domain-containing protein [Roseateles violae]|uniref:DUF2950 domain-containing protein n=1 Tax=Roseateles violae TaxID=3058042 RepID=A0ABT8DVM0_9BURK|nr:DUF2950 domain-containing protein [Pelomonas sp. PFR6]MDN3922317.1 DUF2950 domain-containing protein [Pelomonas sp. PFR6]
MKQKNTSLIACGLLALALAAPGGARAQTAYATPEVAADALISAVAANDEKALTRVLGAKWRELLPPQDLRSNDRQLFLDKAREARAVSVDKDRGELLIGNDKWPLPIPLARTPQGQWKFDISGGRQALLERRIGTNEQSAIQAALAYVDAQRDYALADRNGDGIPEYARRLLSNPGKRDGLIWDPKLGDDSPLGEGFIPSKPGTGYHGYRFKILEAQGPHAAGGARSYLLGDRLLTGYALVAWPVLWGQSGVMSFIVNHDGVVYERDLGPQTSKLAGAIKQFDPDEHWKRVTP